MLISHRHTWRSIVHQQESKWLATWRSEIMGANKYVFFSDETAALKLKSVYEFEFDEVKGQFVLPEISEPFIFSSLSEEISMLLPSQLEIALMDWLKNKTAEIRERDSKLPPLKRITDSALPLGMPRRSTPDLRGAN